jgi:predicted nucleic acid-binding Zn ribbon protein
MVETHDCLWCQKTIPKNILFCSENCVTQYNKQYKTEKEMTNWEYVNTKFPGAHERYKIACVVLFFVEIVIVYLKTIRVYSSWVAGLLLFLSLGVFCTYLYLTTRTTHSGHISR